MVPPTGLTAYIKQCIMAWWDSRPLSFLYYLPPVPNKHVGVKTYQYLLSLFAFLLSCFPTLFRLYLFIFLPACCFFFNIMSFILSRQLTQMDRQNLYARIKSNHLLFIRIFLFLILSTPFLHRYHDATEQNTDKHKHIFCFPHWLHAIANTLCNII